MAKKKVETKVIYIIFDSQNNVYARKYLSKVEDLTGILKTTLNPFKIKQLALLPSSLALLPIAFV